MARMSIDDKFPRDPRVIRLGKVFGWSRREAIGALIDVYQIAYDRVTDVLPEVDIDTAAERDGFTPTMIEVGLAERVRGGIRIKGAKARIKYLRDKTEAGKEGGVKSGESRRKRREAKKKSASGDPKAGRNPPDVVPDPAPVPDLVQIPDPTPARAIPLPVAWSGPPDHRALAARKALAKEIRDAVNAARERASKAIPGSRFRPLDAQDPGERALSTYIVGATSLDEARATLLHVVEMATVEAIAKNGLQWLTLSAIFSEKNRTRFAGGSAAEFSRPDRGGPDIAAICATPAEMDSARAVLDQLSDGTAPIVWRVEDGHAAIVVQRLREVEAVRPGLGQVELCAVAAVCCDELAGRDATKALLTPSFVFGSAKFAEHLTKARAKYAANIAERAERAERRKAGA